MSQVALGLHTGLPVALGSSVGLGKPGRVASVRLRPRVARSRSSRCYTQCGIDSRLPAGESAQPGGAAATAQQPRVSRRSAGALAPLLALALAPAAAGTAARADPSGPFCDFTQTLPCDDYPQYTQTPSGLLYQDLRYGEGAPAGPGEQVTVDWDGYTFYLSHVLQARNLPKGGDFTSENDEAFLRFVVGEGKVIPAFEECVKGMRVGGIRRIIVHPGPLSYPGVLTARGGTYKEVGPAPASLSGRRALEFVLKNTANVDKSLLFDVELLGVGDKVQFKRGPGTWAEGVLAKLS